MSNFVFSENSQPEPVTIEFADGARSLPDHILRAVNVLQLQSDETLAALKKVTWDEFLAMVEKEIARSQLNASFSRERMLGFTRKQERGF